MYWPRITPAASAKAVASAEASGSTPSFPTREEGEPSVDLQSRQEGHDGGHHHDERWNTEASRDEVADGSDGDRRGRRPPGLTELDAVDAQQDCLPECTDQADCQDGS